jgi:hypothetical protein
MLQLLDAFISSWYFKIFAFSWFAIWILGSVVYRRWNDKYFLRPKFPNPLFEETRASGRSLRSVITRIGGANRCLWIVVADNMLHIGPHFPFNLMFLPEFYGLEYHIPAEKIIAVEKIDRLLRRPKVRTDFQRDLIGDEAFELDCKRPVELVAALDEIRAKVKVLV